MLILTRKIEEKILIGENISICILDISREQVKIGIDAPRDIPIVRQEILDNPQRDGVPSVRHLRRQRYNKDDDCGNH